MQKPFPGPTERAFNSFHGMYLVSAVRSKIRKNISIIPIWKLVPINYFYIVIL